MSKLFNLPCGTYCQPPRPDPMPLIDQMHDVIHKMVDGLAEAGLEQSYKTMIKVAHVVYTNVIAYENAIKAYNKIKP